MNIIQHNYDSYRGIKEKVSLLPHAEQGLWNIGGFNLPDFGISEKLGIGPANSAITNKGGLDYKMPTPYSPSVLGTNSNQGPGGAYPIAAGPPPQTTSPSSAPKTNNSSGGSDRSLRDRMQSGEIPWDDNLLAQAEAANRDINAEIENAFNSRMGYLNQAESTIRADYPTIQNEINQNYDNSRTALDTERGRSTREIDTAMEGGEQRREDALSAARRLYNELVMGGQQRFGGASTAGEAYQALAGREMQRNQGDVQKQFSQFMGQIENARTSLNERFTQAMTTLETQKNQALQNARREFDNKLLEISRMRSEAESDKANARLSALQDLRNQIFQINLVSAQMRQEAQQQAQSAAAELDSAVSSFSQNVLGANQAGTELGNNVPLNYSTGLGISMGRGPSGFDTQTGMINFNVGQDDEDYLVQTGQIRPRDDFRSQFGFLNR